MDRLQQWDLGGDLDGDAELANRFSALNEVERFCKCAAPGSDSALTSWSQQMMIFSSDFEFINDMCVCKYEIKK